jgi:hypothetical protein
MARLAGWASQFATSDGDWPMQEMQELHLTSDWH